MVRNKGTVRWGAWQKLWEAMGCLIGPEGQQERLRKAMASLNQLHDPYETNFPPEMVEEFTQFMEKTRSEPTSNPDEVDSRAKEILHFYTGLYRHACDVADGMQEAYAEREAELNRENKKLRQEIEDLKALFPPDERLRKRLERLGDMLKEYGIQSAKPKRMKRGAENTEKLGTTKANTTGRKTTQRRKPKQS